MSLIRCLIYPEEKKIGCVIVQAIAGGDSKIPGIFLTEHWKLTPQKEGGVMMNATQEQWQALADKWNGLKDANQPTV